MNLRSFTTTTELIHEAARFCTTFIRQQTRRPFLLALSGGRTAEGLCRALAKLNTPDHFAQVHFFWADERCVPPDHPQSNFALAQRELLGPLRIPQDQIHRIEGELDPTTAAHRAETVLRQLAHAEGLPRLDLVILGMGEDGHVASLFPGQHGPLNRLFYDVIGPKPPPHRVSMSYPLLEQASQALVLVSGTGKAEALQRSIHSGATPLGHLIHSGLALEVWMDFPLESSLPRS